MRMRGTLLSKANRGQRVMVKALSPVDPLSPLGTAFAI